MLLVLKIIGIVILCLVVLSAAVLAVFLLLPSRYRLFAKGKNQQICVSGTLSMVFGAVQLQLEMDKEVLEACMKILGIPCRRVQIDQVFEKGRQGAAEFVGWETAAAQDSGRSGNGTAKTKENGFAEFVRRLPEMAKRAFHKISEIKRILRTKTGRRTVRIVKANGKKLLAIVKPELVSGTVRYGFEDAALTAVVFGAAAGLAANMPGGQLELVPDFLETGVELDVHAEGKFCMKPVLGLIFGTISDEGVKRTFLVIRRILNG